MLTGATSITFGFTNGAGQIWLTNVQCRGTESRVIDCDHSTFGNFDCVHSEDAGVRCTNAGTSNTSGSSSSGVPSYVWAIVPIVVGGIIIAMIAAGTIFYLRKMKKTTR